MRATGATCGDRGPKLAATGVTATIGSEWRRWRKWSSQEDVDTMERLRCPEDDEEVATESAQTMKKTELVRKKKKNSCHRIEKSNGNTPQWKAATNSGIQRLLQRRSENS